MASLVVSQKSVNARALLPSSCPSVAALALLDMTGPPGLTRLCALAKRHGVLLGKWMVISGAAKSAAISVHRHFHKNWLGKSMAIMATRNILQSSFNNFLVRSKQSKKLPTLR